MQVDDHQLCPQWMSTKVNRYFLCFVNLIMDKKYPWGKSLFARHVLQITCQTAVLFFRV